MKRRVFLHGPLRTLCPDGLEIDAATASEAINGLCHRFKGALTPKPGQLRHAFTVKGFDTVDSLGRRLGDDVVEIHLVPTTFAGAKRAGLAQIVIGVILIVAAVYTAGTSTAAFGAGMFGTTAGTVMWTGVTMLAAGLLATMSQAPKMDMPGWTSETNPDASKYLGAPGNTTKLGTRIPIPYGTVKMHGHILSTTPTLWTWRHDRLNKQSTNCIMPAPQGGFFFFGGGKCTDQLKSEKHLLRAAPMTGFLSIWMALTNIFKS